MKLPASTWILILLALGLGGFVYYREVYQQGRSQVSQAQTQQLFDFKKEDIKQIAIELPKQTIELEKTTREINPWQLKNPYDVAANTGVVIFLVDLLVNSKIDRNIEISPTQLVEYGLDKPTAKLKISLQNNTKYELNLGRISFDEQFIYAQTSAKIINSDKVRVFLLPKSFQDAVVRETREWKNKDLTEEDKKIDTSDTNSTETNSTKNETQLNPKPKTVEKNRTEPKDDRDSSDNNRRSTQENKIKPNSKP
jgi:Domain of unknown function (DUF4340)